MKKYLLIILFGILSITSYAQKLSKNEDELKKEYLERAHKSYEYKKAFEDVNEVKINVKLAKDGTLSSAQVINQYNNLLASHLGPRKTLKGVEDVINKKGDAYIQYTLLRCAAKLALEDAAEKSN